MSPAPIPLLQAKDKDGATVLRAPMLGVWSDPPPEGALVASGSTAGRLTQLGRRFVLTIPAGVAGRLAIAGRREGARPVEYGETLFRVLAMTGVAVDSGAAAGSASRGSTGLLEIAAPTDGVFYRSPSVDAKPYAAVGDRIAIGRPVGLIEVMKTFNPIVYGGPGFPDEAEVVEVVANDGQEVRAGQALVRVKRL